MSDIKGASTALARSLEVEKMTKAECKECGEYKEVCSDCKRCEECLNPGNHMLSYGICFECDSINAD